MSKAVTRYYKRRGRRNTKAVENKGISSRRKLFVYGGRELLGVFVFNERTGIAHAWDSQRRFIGQFDGFKAAAAAIGAPKNAIKDRAATGGACHWAEIA